MRRSIGLTVLLMALTHSAGALAQRRSVVERDRLAIGGSAGPTSPDNSKDGHIGIDVAGLLEQPVVSPWRLRLELGHSRGSVSTLTRLTAGAIRTGPLLSGLPTLYVGGGIGFYHYRFDLGSSSVNSSQAGVYGVGGLEVRKRRVAFGGEFRAHFVAGSQASSTPLLVPSLSGVIKLLY